MADSLVAEFSSMDGEGRVRALMALVKRCSYRQKLDFIEQLQKHMHRDFLAALPSTLSARIIGFLGFEDALVCLVVCKAWNKVVGDCTDYWAACAQKLGLTTRFLEESLPRYKGLKDVCASAMNHQRHVRSLAPRTIVVARSPAEEAHTYVYAGRGTALRYENVNSNAHSQIVIESMTTPHFTMVPVVSFSAVPFSSRIKWAGAANNYVLWKQVDGKWLGHDLTVGGELEEWIDEPLSQGFHSVTCCCKCRLVAILSEAEDDCEVWDLQVVKLVPDTASPRKMVYPLPLEKIQRRGMKKRHFLGGDVTLLSEDAQQRDKNGFCLSHRVLLQVDDCISVHTLTAVTAKERMPLIHQLLPDAQLSKPLHILRPSRVDDDPLKALEGIGGLGPPVFCISADSKRLGMVHESYLYVWNLETGYVEESCVDLLGLTLPPDIKCIALGSLYAILASDTYGKYVVVQTGTGEICLAGGLAEDTFNPSAHRSSRFKFYPPLRQEWLSTFEYFDFWPLTLALDGFAQKDKSTRECELQSVVGVLRNRQRPRPLPLLDCVL